MKKGTKINRTFLEALNINGIVEIEWMSGRILNIFFDGIKIGAAARYI